MWQQTQEKHLVRTHLLSEGLSLSSKEKFSYFPVPVLTS